MYNEETGIKKNWDCFADTFLFPIACGKKKVMTARGKISTPIFLSPPPFFFNRV